MTGPCTALYVVVSVSLPLSLSLCLADGGLARRETNRKSTETYRRSKKKPHKPSALPPDRRPDTAVISASVCPFFNPLRDGMNSRFCLRRRQRPSYRNTAATSAVDPFPVRDAAENDRRPLSNSITNRCLIGKIKLGLGIGDSSFESWSSPGRSSGAERIRMRAYGKAVSLRPV